jgi:hypothetical protein
MHYATSCAIRRERVWGAVVRAAPAAATSGRALIAVRWRRSPVFLNRHNIRRPDSPKRATLLGGREPEPVFFANDELLPEELFGLPVVGTAD